MNVGDKGARAIQDHDKLLKIEVDKIHDKWNQVNDFDQQQHNGPVERYDQVVSSVTHQSSSHSVRQGGGQRRRFHHGYNNLHNDNDAGTIGPTVCHIRRGLVVMPIEMTITDDASSGGSSAAPSYSMRQSNVALYAAFPPPLPCAAGWVDDEFEMIQVKKRLKQYSGFYGAVGTTSATLFGQGYADTILSLNYRFPTLLCIPVRNRQTYAILGNLRSNLHFGPTTKLSMGGTVSSLDGTTNLRLDTCNPFSGSFSNREKGILHLHPQRRDYTLSVSRDFVTCSNPIRVHLMTKIRPTRRFERFHFGYFNVVVTSSQGTTNKNRSSNEVTPKSKISMCAGYGEPSQGGEALWMSQLTSSSDVHSRDCGINIHKTDFTTSGSNGGARVKLDLEQPLSQSQSCQSTIEYHHVGQALSLGTLLTRTFASSKLASVGVGIRHTFGNIFNVGSKWWNGGVTSWIFLIQRGETRIVVPIKIHPIEVTTWDSVLQICYASLATILVDTLVAELLCDEISKLRLKFLKFVLGEDSVMRSHSLLADRRDKRKVQEDESRWIRLQLISKAREEALCQSDLMKRRAINAMKKEEHQDGLVILNAIYGVLDNETGKWIETSDKSASKLHMMDATTQLQFWVESSALHMSGVSKQHCLGFYDVAACVSEEDWRKSEVDSKDVSNLGLFQRLRNIVGMSNSMDNRRDLVAALQVRYKWAGHEFVKMFHDEDTIDLP
eukprot:scaffold11146_cov144-Skeletonema_marinoi.AAC.8